MDCKRSIKADKGKLNSNNKGVSFVELVVVVAILAVMAATMSYGLTLLVNADSKKASKNLYQALSQLRNDTLSQTGTWYGELRRTSSNGQYTFTTYREDDQTHVVEQKDQIQLGSRLTITGVGNSTTTVSDTNYIRIYFTPGSGTVKSILDYANASLKNPSSIRYEFTITANNGLEYKLVLWTNTGKVTSE